MDQWMSVGLSKGLCEALVKQLKLQRLTSCQAASLPATLKGSDCIIQAPTGSGKTLAYVLPIVQRAYEKLDARTVILAPSRELTLQTSCVIEEVKLAVKKTSCASFKLAIGHTADSAHCGNVRHTIFDVLVTTPTKFLDIMEDLSFVESFRRAPMTGAAAMMVLDEVDLLFDLQCQNSIVAISEKLCHRGQRHYQTIATSATLAGNALEYLKESLNDPVFCEDSGKKSLPGLLMHSFLECEEKDKYCIVYALLKLRMVPLRVVAFRRDIAKAYQLKLFLDKIGLQSEICSPLMPLDSRASTIKRYNNRSVQILVVPAMTETMAAVDHAASKTRKKVEGFLKADEQFKNMRGLDLKDTECVINCDMPSSEAAYVHRAGRTARRGNRGQVISLVDRTKEQETSLKHQLENKYSDSLHPMVITPQDVTCLNYRVGDVIKSLGPNAIRSSIMRNFHMAVLQAKSLTSFFDEHPSDRYFIQRELRRHKPINQQMHEKQTIPCYLAEHTDLVLQKNPVLRKLKLSKVAKTAKVFHDPLQSFGRKKYTMSRPREPDHKTTNMLKLPATSARKVWQSRHGFSKHPHVGSQKLYPAAKIRSGKNISKQTKTLKGI